MYNGRASFIERMRIGGTWHQAWKVLALLNRESYLFDRKRLESRHMQLGEGG
ncbi:hypothetical protein [Cohnella endophytica]|uniref:hypothetical protein n=1 Tax=Cohnella endophytica TaxID=2419778 RepID=UPI0013147D62|nr:hypothetical protein [Cohnella endophytica]